VRLDDGERVQGDRLVRPGLVDHLRVDADALIPPDPLRRRDWLGSVHVVSRGVERHNTVPPAQEASPEDEPAPAM